MESYFSGFLIVTILYLMFFIIKTKCFYWKSRGVPSVPPSFPFGNLRGVGKSTSFGQRLGEIYLKLRKSGAPIGGMHFFLSPQPILLNIDLLKNILVKDFQYFHSRGTYSNANADPLSANLFAIEGSKWRELRNKLSPTFTTGKMKLMQRTMLSIATQFQKHLEPIAQEELEVEMSELLAQFTTDVIGNVAFGLECNSFKDTNNEFRKFGKKIVHTSTPFFLRQLLINTFPKLALKLNLKLLPTEPVTFLTESIRKTVDYRERNGIHRNDFLQLLMQLKNTGTLDVDKEKVDRLSFEELAAQTFIFYLGGFETSSSTMAFSCYELAVNQEIQEKARDEINQVLLKNGGIWTYEAFKELHYLDQIINETMRKYPILPFLWRKAEKDYKVPGSEIIIQKGMVLQIPLLGIHHDPEIYPEPEKFDPERFTEEAISCRHPFAWMPFGKGPRECIGMRFGIYQMRVGLATLLQHYSLMSTNKTAAVLDPNGFFLSPLGGVHLRMKKIQCAELGK